VNAVDNHIAETLQVRPSAHLGGCGGANGEIDDEHAIASNPAIIDATKAVMEVPAVRDYLETPFDEELAEEVKSNAAVTAKYLEEEGWSGATYVARIAEEEPAGVEDLEVDHDDEKFHGHKEDILAIVIGEKTIAEDDMFVVNLSTIKAAAKALSQGDSAIYGRAITAGIAKHMATAKRLPSEETPVMLLAA
jgi:hypothetical protein